MQGLQRRIVASLAVLAVIVSLGLLAQRYTSLEWLIARETRLRILVHQHPMQSWLVGFLSYICLSLIPGTSGKSVIFGWLFGFWPAVVLVDSALTIAALFTFVLSRLMLREALEHRFGVHLQNLRDRLHQNAGFYLLTLRLVHAPFSFVNYSVGATNIVPLFTFWWTTQLGLLPGTMVFVFAGTRIPTLTAIAENGVLSLLDVSLVAGLIATALLPISMRWAARIIQQRTARRHADCDSEISETDHGE